MKSSLLFSIFLFVVITNGFGQRNIDPPAMLGKGIVLKDLSGQQHEMDKLVDNKAVVFYMLSPDCPLCQSYTLTFNSFNLKYGRQGMVSVGVFPGKLYSKEEIIAFKNKFNVNMLLVLDPDYILTNNLRASVTPQAFLLGKGGSIVYSGRIDNWAYSLGKTRQKATEHNLKDAIELVLAGKEIVMKRTRAVGCIIE